MMIPRGQSKTETFRISTPTIFRTLGRMVGLHRRSNELLSRLHWQLGKLAVFHSQQSQPLKRNCGRLKCQMHLKDFVWPSGKSLFVSGLKCEMRIASGRHIVLGTKCINSMMTLESVGLPIDMPGVPCNIWKSTPNT